MLIAPGFHSYKHHVLAINCTLLYYYVHGITLTYIIVHVTSVGTGVLQYQLLVTPLPFPFYFYVIW